MFVKNANLLGWRAKKYEEKVVVKIVKWILLGLSLIVLNTEIYAENRYINNMMVLNENEDSDTAEIAMSGNGESCRLSFGSDGIIYNTSCRTMVNSKGVKIYCTAKKKLCKTYDEIYAFIFNPQPKKITFRGVVSSSAIELDDDGAIWFSPKSNNARMIFDSCKSGDYCEIVGVVNDGFLVSVNNAKKINSANLAQANNHNTIPHYTFNGVYKLEGRIEQVMHYGPPGYGEDPQNDKKLTAYILKLLQPIKVLSSKDDEFNFTTETSEVQLVIHNFENIKKLISNKSTVFLSGEFFSSHTGYHIRKLLMDVKSINIKKKNTTAANKLITPIGAKKTNIVSSSSNITWRDLGIGIHNPGEIKDWTYYGIKTPEEASEWISALKPLGGISYAGAARIWKQNGFSASEVKEWVLIGTKTPERAQWWIKSGAKTPFEVREWRNIGVDTTNNIYAWKSTEFNTPSKAKTWIDINIKESSEVEKWLNAGVNRPKHVQEWKAVGVQDYNDVRAWKKNGLTTPKEVQAWKGSGITTAEQASRWIQADVTSISEIKKWQEIGINDGNTCKEWKKYVQDIDGVKEWMDASYTLSDVASQVNSGNLSPSDVKWSKMKNIFWVLILIIVGIFGYRALQLKCPKCKSRNFTKIDEKSQKTGYQQYSKKGNTYTKVKGLSQKRGKYKKVEAVSDVTATYRCDDCGEVFENITTSTKEI